MLCSSTDLILKLKETTTVTKFNSAYWVNYKVGICLQLNRSVTTKIIFL